MISSEAVVRSSYDKAPKSAGLLVIELVIMYALTLLSSLIETEAVPTPELEPAALGAYGEVIPYVRVPVSKGTSNLI